MTADPLSPFTDDLREYYVSDNPDIAALDTLEFRHASFVDALGAAAAVRVVNDPSDLVATLETDAPMNAGAQVTFTRCAFSVALPASLESGLPTFDIEVSNVSAELMPYLDKAALATSAIEMSYRQYLSDDLTSPAIVIHGFTVNKANATAWRVTASAEYMDFVNRAFPFRLISKAKYRGLDR